MLNPTTCIRPQDNPQATEVTVEADRGSVLLTVARLDLWSMAQVSPTYARLIARALDRIADEAERQGARAACETDGKGGGI